MSHFTTLVLLPGDVTDVDAALDEVMAPYDENIQVEPYRNYEDDSPEDYWLVSSLRRGAEHHRNGTGLKPYDPKFAGFSTACTNKSPDEQRAEFAEDAAWLEKLGEPATWERIVAIHNERFGDSEPLYYDAEQDRAYSMTTYNPQSRWDGWKIGGRWRGQFPIADARDAIATSPNSRFAALEAPVKPGYCDGGRKRSLDLSRLRAEKSAEAEVDWNAYAGCVFGTPEALPWRVFAERVDQSGNGGYSMEDARKEYAAQPRVAAIRASEKFGGWWNDPLETFDSVTRDEYAATQAARAVPGYATLDAVHGGGWIAPGRMGWFGMGSDTSDSYAEYTARMNALVDALPDDAWLVLLDCHI